MVDSANVFRKKGVQLRKQLWWTDMRFKIAIAAAVLLLIVVIFFAVCLRPTALFPPISARRGSRRNSLSTLSALDPCLSTLYCESAQRRTLWRMVCASVRDSRRIDAAARRLVPHATTSRSLTMQETPHAPPAHAHTHDNLLNGEMCHVARGRRPGACSRARQLHRSCGCWLICVGQVCRL